jgi:tetratricopeptide (TPR) repeat protein
MFEKEAKVLETGLGLFPDNIDLIWGKARLEISEGNIDKANELIDKYKYLCKQNGSSDSDIEIRIGSLYEEANSLDQAEDHYRTALKSNPNNYKRMNSLAFFLADHNKKAYEAEELAKKVLNVIPGDPTALHTQGLIRLKDGRYEEALKLLLAVKDSSLGGFPQLDQQIKEAKKAIADKN